MSDTQTSTAPAPDLPVQAEAPSIPTALDLRSTILASDDITVEPIEIPEWGIPAGLLAVKSMTGATRAAMLKSAMDPETGEMDFANMYAEVIIATLVTIADQQPLFSTNDRPLLNQKSGSVLEKVAGAGMRVSGMDRDAEERLGKDSSTESGGSTTN